MIDGVTAAQTSNAYVNNECDICSVQVTGTFSSATVYLQGLIDEDAGTWVNLAVLGLSEYDLATTGITAKGIFECGIEGVRQVRANVSAVSGGSVSVYANFANSAAQ